MSLDAEFERVSLPLSRPFTISRGTTETAENVLVRITDGEGNEGVGNAAPSTRYGETADTVEAVLPDLLAAVGAVGDPHELDRIERRMRETVRGNRAAKCAVTTALYDLVGKRVGLPLYRYWGLDPGRTVETSFTLGIDAPDRMAERARETVDAGYETLKVKLGSDHDVEIVEAVRGAAPGATIRVDANEAWTPREAVRTIDALADYGVEFVEQPVPADDPGGLRFVHERAALPVAADESCLTAADVPEIADRADIANVKLMKCGGPREALRVIHAARAHGLEVMLGCMVESNASIAAACHLVPLVDYADLDGALLLADDPYEGVPMPGGDIDLSGADRPGTGARPVE